MDEISALRNFKDFLLIYNRMTEVCFSRCVDSLNQRNLTINEEYCVDKCANKHVNANHKIMSIYMEVQPQIANKRNEELQQQMQANAIAAENDIAHKNAIGDIPLDQLQHMTDVSTED